MRVPPPPVVTVILTLCLASIAAVDIAESSNATSVPSVDPATEKEPHTLNSTASESKHERLLRLRRERRKNRTPEQLARDRLSRAAQKRRRKERLKKGPAEVYDAVRAKHAAYSKKYYEKNKDVIREKERLKRIAGGDPIVPRRVVRPFHDFMDEPVTPAPAVLTRKVQESAETLPLFE